jgi:hypothetical protein
VFSILFSPYLIWLNMDHPYLFVGFCSGVSASPGSVGAVPGLIGLPARPPGLVPHVDASEDRLGVFDRHLPDRAIVATVDLLDDERAHCYVSELGIELDCGFHFEFSFFIIV